MIQKLSDKEYEELKERVIEGKKHLDGRWSVQDELCPISKTYERYCVSLWYELSDTLMQQSAMRGVFGSKQQEVAPNRIAGETPDEYVERMQIKLIQQRRLTGKWTKPFLRAYLTKKGGAKEVNDIQRPNSHHLFESS